VEPVPHDPAERESGLPYPLSPPSVRDDLPGRGQPGAPASWALRALARIIDVLLFSLLFSFLIRLLGTEAVAGPDGGLQLTGPRWPLLLQPLAFIAYEAVAVSLYGQTIGKFLCQLKVVRHSDGHLADQQQGFVRAFVPGVFLLVASSAPLVGVGVLGYLQLVPPVIYLASIADALYRGPHDKAAGTIVLSAPRYRTARAEPEE
jgi:uncharacterized RDD family membrane protein YckC